MTRDLNRLMQDMNQAREVFVTADGEIEDVDEARDNRRREKDEDGQPRPRTVMKHGRFADVSTVRVESTVLDAMHAEAGRHPGETGGIIVGPDADTVTRLITSGPDARQTAASYELDVDYIQPLLAKAEDHGLQFLGIWHTHPSGYSEFSDTDRHTMRTILADRDWHVSQLIMPLTVRCKGGFTTEFFVVAGEKPVVRPARLVVGSTRAFAPAGPARLERAGEMELLTTARAGSERLAREIAELRHTKWQVSVREEHQGLLVVLAERDGAELFLCLPPEFPFAPPDVVASVGGVPQEIARHTLPETASWSSIRSLATVAAQALALLKDEPTERASMRRSRFASLVSPLFG